MPIASPSLQEKPSSCPAHFRSSPRTISATLITLSSALLLAGARTRASGDACSLITKEDAAAALGGPATGPESLGPRPAGPGSTVTHCEYTGSGTNSVKVNLTRLAASSVAMFKGLCAKAKRDGLTGIGELACWYQDEHSELHAFKGNAFLVIQLQNSRRLLLSHRAVRRACRP